MFSLIELNDDNYEELSKLEISEVQETYVLDFKKCIKYKEENPFLKIYGIKMDNTYIGLTAFARWDSDESIPVINRWTWFDEFFLDLKYQHKGYGKILVPMILEKIKNLYNPKFIVLSVKLGNTGAKKLYKELGFVDTDLIYDEDLDQVRRKKKMDITDEEIMFYYC